MNAVRMMFRATESYYARLNRAKQADDLRKCRCWFDCRDEDVTVTLDNQGIALEYGKKTNRAAWPALIRVTELRDGLLLRLTERRLLFLPAGADDEALIAAGILLGRQCRATFRTARTRLRGVSFGRWLAYHTRSGQWFNLGMQSVRLFVLLLICLSIVAGTLLTWSPFTWNRLVSREEAAAETAVFEDYEAEYRNKVTYSQLRGISVRFEGLGVREVDGNCPIAKVKNNLALARPGQVMNLLIHQQTGELLAMETEDVVVLSYEDYVKYYRRHDAFNVIFGLLIYTGAAGLILELKKEKRK